MTSLLRPAASLLLLMVLIAPRGAAQGLAPDELMIFYGWPGRGMGPCNGCFPEGSNVDRRAAEFGRYDDLILGAGLELASHPEHDLVDALISHPGMAGTRVWGYIDAGVTTNDFSVAEITARALSWRSMGAHGIFLDDFGYDFGTGRTRQNSIVANLHALGMPVIANAFDPDDAFGRAVHPVYNPAGDSTLLNSGDVYFYESHGVRLDVLESAENWMAKSEALRAFQSSIGFDIYSSTSKGTDIPTLYDEEGFFAAWMLASIAGHASTGYAEYQYSAAGQSNAAHIYRSRPTTWLGTSFLGGFSRSGDAVSRLGNAGMLYVNLATGTSTVLASTDAPSLTQSSLRLDEPTPNPFNPRTQIGFAADPGRPVRLEIFDARGRSVRVLVAGQVGATQRTINWDGRDDRGRELASAVYFVRLQQGAQSAVRKIALVR